MEMGKRKKGRPRGRSGVGGVNQRGGNHFRRQPNRPRPASDNSNGENRNLEQADNGEPGPVEPGKGRA